jgi:hypothetical protein
MMVSGWGAGWEVGRYLAAADGDNRSSGEAFRVMLFDEATGISKEDAAFWGQ